LASENKKSEKWKGDGQSPFFLYTLACAGLFDGAFFLRYNEVIAEQSEEGDLNLGDI